jgi:crotonobetainyl-CoA:carnitine CoA-transferase CaiB-like acyl-CoA transferase
MPGAPYRFSGLAPARIKPAPSLGQHNDEIYGGRLRYDAGRIRDLAEATAI